MMISTSLGVIVSMAFAGNGWWARWQPYLDYPGFEVWKFFNLTIFVVALLIVLRKFGLPQLFRDRKETIKRDLARAQEERDAALAKLREVEARLGKLDQEVAAIKERSKQEAAAERERIAKSTETEIARLSEQAQREIENAGKLARTQLRRYTAEQSVKLAEQMIRREIRPDDDAHLIKENIEEMGGTA